MRSGLQSPLTPPSSGGETGTSTGHPIPSLGKVPRPWDCLPSGQGDLLGDVQAADDFSAGDRVVLVKVADSYMKLRAGDEGSVVRVAGVSVHVGWDSGSSLSMLLVEGDRIEHPG